MNASSAPPRLSVQGLSKSFNGVSVLHSVSFKAFGGKVLGIVGENGSGKSTTLNVLTGVLARDAGEVLLDGAPFNPRSRAESDAAGVAFIQQELNVFPNLTVAENLFIGRPQETYLRWPLISRRKRESRARQLLERVTLAVSPNTLAGTLSSGERQLLEIARGLSHDAKAFLLDEPTTSLTALERERLFSIIARLKAQDVAVLYISHNLDDVLALSDDVLVMRDGRVTLQAPRVGLSSQMLVLAMVGRSITSLFPEVSPTRPPVAATVLDVQGLSEPGVLDDIHVHVNRGEVVGLAGLMGSGRTELARAVFGLDSHRTGVVRLAGQELPPLDIEARIQAGMAFLPEDRRHEGLMMDATVADNFALAALPLFSSRRSGRIENQPLLESISSLAQAFNLRSGTVTVAPVRTLSGGNQQKVMLGRWLLRKPTVFILDEPTRGVDVGAKQEIYHLLAEWAREGMSIFMISSELEELLGLCDRIYVMRHGRVAAEFDRGHFDRETILRVALGQESAA